MKVKCFTNKEDLKTELYCLKTENEVPVQCALYCEQIVNFKYYRDRSYLAILATYMYWYGKYGNKLDLTGLKREIKVNKESIQLFAERMQKLDFTEDGFVKNIGFVKDNMKTLKQMSLTNTLGSIKSTLLNVGMSVDPYYISTRLVEMIKNTGLFEFAVDEVPAYANIILAYFEALRELLAEGEVDSLLMDLVDTNNLHDLRAYIDDIAYTTYHNPGQLQFPVTGPFSDKVSMRNIMDFLKSLSKDSEVYELPRRLLLDRNLFFTELSWLSYGEDDNEDTIQVVCLDVTGLPQSDEKLTHLKNIIKTFEKSKVFDFYLIDSTTLWLDKLQKEKGFKVQIFNQELTQSQSEYRILCIYRSAKIYLEHLTRLQTCRKLGLSCSFYSKGSGQYMLTPMFSKSYPSVKVCHKGGNFKKKQDVKTKIILRRCYK